MFIKISCYILNKLTFGVMIKKDVYFPYNMLIVRTGFSMLEEERRVRVTVQGVKNEDLENMQNTLLNFKKVSFLGILKQNLALCVLKPPLIIIFNFITFPY